MKQLLLRNGGIYIEDVPSPVVESNKILVKTLFSCISIGTEASGIKMSSMPIWQKAFKQPEKVKKAFDLLRNKGILTTLQTIKGELESGKPLGYSLVGKVVEIGESIQNLRVGDLVACAGNQCAYHAEYVSIPKNLFVKVPQNIDLASASTVALGSIAMQGIRRLSPALGDTIVVLGLGFIGLVTCLLLKQTGCKVIAVDIDKKRIDLAKNSGIEIASTPLDALEISKIYTRGYGADGVIVTASGSSNEIISKAFNMCRKKGKLVLVGDVGLNLKRADIYQKELDFLISTSYGPGRYDESYEEKGIDYPLPYVRWTETRNMEEYMHLIANKKIDITPFIEKIVDFENAPSAYEELKSSEKPLMIVLKYSDKPTEVPKKVLNPKVKKVSDDRIKIGIAGVGGFAKGTHLPNMKKLSNLFCVHAIMSRTGHNAKSVTEQYGACYSTTDFNDLLNDKDLDVIFITSRHNTHADFIVKSLAANKNVFVEKPLATNEEELSKIVKYFNGEFSPLLFVGFNRRFSSAIQKIKEELRNRVGPLYMIYRVNALYAPLNSWVHEDGGRIIGEVCHFIDVLLFLAGSKITSIQKNMISPHINVKYLDYDNIVISISFEDGSLGIIHYVSMGNKALSKEYLEIHYDDKSIVLDNFKELHGFGTSFNKLTFSQDEKGLLEELKVLHKALQEGGKFPISLDDMIAVTKATFEIMKR